MSEIDITSCRVCLKPDGTFISIYNKINDQDVLTLIHNVTKMVVSYKWPTQFH